MTDKRLIIIVEGQTEKEFVNVILRPYFSTKGIFDISVFTIKQSGGGLSKYNHIKTNILNCIYQSNTVITTLIDFYGLPGNFPNFGGVANIDNKLHKVEFLEKSMKEELENSQKNKFDNFLPYIQLHEFEALVFSSKESILNNFESNKIDMLEIEKIFREFDNPEEINNSVNTAPSKRLLKHKEGYDKVVDGVRIIEQAGLNKVLEKCPRFAAWLNKVILKVKS